MKRFFLCLLAFLPALAFAQNAAPFTIKAKVGKYNTPAQAFLAYRLGANLVTDSAKIVNGEFTFTGTLANPVHGTIFIDPKGIGFAKFVAANIKDGSGPVIGTDYLGLFVEKGDFSIASADSLTKAKIIGSKVNDDDAKLKASLKPLYEKGAAIYKEAQAAPAAQQQSAAFQNTMQAKFKALQDEQRNTLKNYIATNPDSYLSLMALTDVSGPSPDLAEVEPLFNTLSDELKNSDMGKQLKYALDNLRITAIGSMAPDFIQNDVNGKPVQLSSFRGKYVLIDFWASWCGPCRQENPNVVRTYNKYRGKNFTVLGVSLDKESGKDSWLAAIKSDHLEWTQVSDLKFWKNMAATLYGVHSIPQNFLIDPQGKIVGKNLRGDALDNKLKELLGDI